MFQKELRKLKENLTSNLIIMKKKISFQHLEQRKRKNFDYSKHKSKTQNNSEIHEPSDQTETPTSKSHYTPQY